MLFGHGDDFYNSQNEVKINFSSNVWHGANLDKLKEHLNEHFSKLTRYPEPDAASLKRLLARRYEIKEENVVVTNGSPSICWHRLGEGLNQRLPFLPSLSMKMPAAYTNTR